MKIRDPQDFWAGLMFMVLGSAFMWLARNYAYGSAAKMGPGYFPTMLGGILVALGLITFVRGLVFNGEAVGRFSWKPVLLILGGLILFGISLQRLGLVVAIFALIIISALGGHEFKLKEVLILAVSLTIGSVAIFIYGLQLQFPIWPW